MITEIKNLDDYKTAISSPGFCVIDFYTTWCGPYGPSNFKHFSEVYTNIKFYQSDVDNNQEVAAECDVICMPTFKFYKSGNLVGEIKGANIKELERILKENN
ncbi:cytosolic thioredoxin Trx1 [Neocallimastix lanati (nom. inval.)]|nr:cytosolic thioredoxin Trx1 [Neocallimastix sp. JGI-2020a]